MSDLADKIEALAKRETDRGHGPWYIETEPHDYKDGTKHFTHVRCRGRDVKGAELTISIGDYLTPGLAELLITLHNNVPEIVAALRNNRQWCPSGEHWAYVGEELLCRCTKT